MKPSVQEIGKFVETNRDLAVEFLQKVVQTPSPTNQEFELCAFMEDWLKTNLALDVKAYEEEPGRKSLVVDWEGMKPGKRFLFNGHMDHYPSCEDQSGQFAPFSGAIQDGYLYGQGSADMKCGLCATIMAVYLLKKMGYVPETGTVSLSCDIDEEDGGPQGIVYMLNQGECKADYGVCAEPTHHRVMVAGGSVIWGKVTYTAKPGHPITPHAYKDANRKAAAATALYELGDRINQERFHPLMGCGPTIYVNLIQGGSTSNKCSESCSLVFDRRVMPGESVDGAEREILDLLDGLSAADPEMEYSYHRESYVPQYNLDPNHEIIQSAMRNYQAVTGKKTDIMARHGGSDIHKVVEKYPECNIPNFGPTNESDVGIPDERCCIQDYLDFIKVYMAMVVEMQQDK